jgi:NADH-quinone oxidoreductase subunit L
MVPMLAAAIADGHEPLARAAVATGQAWAGWILWLPAISTLLCGVCAALRVRTRAPAWITVSLLGLSFILTAALYLGFDPAQPIIVPLFDWLHVTWGGETERAAFTAAFALYVDSLTLLWMLFVTGLGTLIALYASEYMEADVQRGYARFFAGVSVFLFAMGCLVMGDNLIMLYIGWEGVGFASYWLIGYYATRPSAVAAAKKAFIMNRVGDLGLALAIWLIYHAFGTVQYDALFAVLEGSHRLEAGGWSVAAIPFLLMLGAFGKSAQLPLYVWLPDAMEGPTPVSALIHAATMVTAGVYLIARMYPLMALHPDALATVAWVGGLTALLAATIGMAQYDIKRIMAYSTVSQLGYMFLGLGVLTSAGAAYHVLTHAFFKAVLFLTCGAIMHGFAGQLDLRRLSGLRHLPGWKITSYTMLYACMCLAGVPFVTSGFFSKDMIMAEAFVTEGPGFRVLGIMAIITAFLTAYYTFRVWFRVCAGPVQFESGHEHHGHEESGHGSGGHGGHGHDSHQTEPHRGAAVFHPHAPRLAINLVLVVITIGAIATMFVKGWAGEMVSHSSAAAGVPAHHEAGGFFQDPHQWMMLVAVIASLGGIAIAWYLHLANRRAAESLRNALRASPATAWLPVALENKWYVDELYHMTIRAPLWIAGHVLAAFDRYVIDLLLVDGTARLPRLLGRAFQPLQNGVLQSYAVSMTGLAGLIALLVLFMPDLMAWLSRVAGGPG